MSRTQEIAKHLEESSVPFELTDRKFTFATEALDDMLMAAGCSIGGPSFVVQVSPLAVPPFVPAKDDQCPICGTIPACKFDCR